jgi:hypothetical protein
MLGGKETITMSSAGKSVVLVHGGFVDGAGWKGVYDILNRDGFDVAIVQNPTLSLAGGPIVLRCDHRDHSTG